MGEAGGLDTGPDSLAGAEGDDVGKADEGGAEDGGADDDGGGAPICAGAGKFCTLVCASAAFMNAAHI